VLDMDNDGLITAKELTDALQFLKANLDEQDLNALLERWGGHTCQLAAWSHIWLGVLSVFCVYVRACVLMCGEEAPMQHMGARQHPPARASRLVTTFWQLQLQ